MRVETYLTSIGAKKTNTDKNTDEYQVESQMILVVSYEFNCISSIFVGFKPALNEENNKRYCMYLPKFQNLLSHVIKLKPLGDFLGKDPIRVMPTSGWRRRNDEYKNAKIIISEKFCTDPDPRLGCGIDWFTVNYWLPLSGKVESKETKSISISETDTPYIEYILKISGKEVFISKKHYDRLTIGCKVSLRIIKRSEGQYYAE
jgi:hypothetical protein